LKDHSEVQCQSTSFFILLSSILCPKISAHPLITVALREISQGIPLFTVSKNTKSPKKNYPFFGRITPRKTPRNYLSVCLLRYYTVEMRIYIAVEEATHMGNFYNTNRFDQV